MTHTRSHRIKRKDRPLDAMIADRRKINRTGSRCCHLNHCGGYGSVGSSIGDSGLVDDDLLILRFDPYRTKLLQVPHVMFSLG